MKYIRSILAAAFMLCAMLAPATVFVGCQSTPAQVAYKTADATVSTVDAAMKAWADYVVAERARIAKLPAGERMDANAALLRREGKVATAFGRYQDAIRAAQAGVKTALSTGGPLPPEVTGAAAALLEVLRSIKG